MKIGPFRLGTIVKGTFRPIVDVPAWLGYRWLKESTLNLINQAKLIYGDQFYRPAREETFQEAITRLNLSENDLAVRLQALKRDSYLFGTGAVLSLLYMFYLFWHTNFIAAIIAYLIGMALIVRMARSRFWIFQIKHQKLGCTLSEWLSGRIEGESQ